MKMKQMIKIIRKVDIENAEKQALKAELDYELLSLHHAIQSQNQEERQSITSRLKEIVWRLKQLGEYV